MSERRHYRLLSHPALWPLAGLLLLFAINLVFGKNFFSLEWRNGHLVGTLVDILKNGSLAMILALGMTLVISTGGIDLSVGSVMAISGASVAILLEHGVESFPLILAAGLGIGILCGAINGLLVSKARIQPIVATLTLMVAGRGLAMLITDSRKMDIASDGFHFLGSGFIFGLPVAPILVSVIYLITWTVLRQTSAGLFLEAAGDNETAGRFAGLATVRIKCLAYVFCGLCAAIAGCFEASFIGQANPMDAGQNMELDAIFAVVIGGTALSGGRFNLLGSFIGALMLQTLTTTMYDVGVPPSVAPVPKALLIIVVCLAQSETMRKWVGSLMTRKATA